MIPTNNNKTITVFTVCFLLSISVQGGFGEAITDLGRALFKTDTTPKRAIMPSIKTVNEHFNQTLDEVLEIKGLSREDIPESVIKHLRDATEDPLKLIDGSLDFDVSRFFGTRFPGDPDFDEYTDIYRAFFQKRLDFNNTKQMNRFATLVEELWLRRFPDADDVNTPRYSVLYALTRHSGFEHSEFDAWYGDLHTALYNRKKFFKEIAENTFKEGFDETTFLHHWQDEAFRKFIVDSRFMTKARLTDRPFLLIRWTIELKEHPEGLEQLSALIRSAFKESAHFERTYHGNNSIKVTIRMDNNDFWNTVLEATHEDRRFKKQVQLILREIDPHIGYISFVPNT